MATRISTASRDAMANGVRLLVDAGAGAGTCKVYTGTQPTTANDAETGTLLATFTLADPAYSASSTGVAALAGTPRATTGLAAGTAGWFRVEDSTGANVFDGTVGTSGQQMNLNTLTVSVGVNLELTSGNITAPAE